MPSTIFSKPLNKQVAQNAADIAALSTSMGNANGAIAIVATGNTAPKAISAGQFVLWSGGLYTANSAIASGETLSSSNLTAVPDGGLNAVKSAIPAVVNNLTSDSTTSALSAAQGKALNSKITTYREWNKVIERTTTPNVNFDETIPITLPTDINEIMFTLMRNSNGRTFASTVIPVAQFSSGAIYAMGSFNIISGPINSQTVPIVNAVAIHTDSSHIELACNALDEAIKMRVFVR